MPAVLILRFSNTEGSDVNDIQVPYFVVDIPPSFDWNYTTVPQKALQNRTLSYPRGHVLGGSTSTSAVSTHTTTDMRLFSTGLKSIKRGDK